MTTQNKVAPVKEAPPKTTMEDAVKELKDAINMTTYCIATIGITICQMRLESASNEEAKEIRQRMLLLTAIANEVLPYD